MTAEEFLTISDMELSMRLKLGRGYSFSRNDREDALHRAEQQRPWLERESVEVYSLLDPTTYPKRLEQCIDAPVNLFQCGSLNLDSRNAVNIVGTRRATNYGLGFVREVVGELKRIVPDLIVFSGLAYGIDAAAHNAALIEGVPTAGVMAHGLHMIYPAQHRQLAQQIIHAGGAIVSEYPFGDKPHRQSFLERNRIIAGLSDVTIVVESAIKGGARSTAADAASYGRETFALPGRLGDATSEGCNRLIADGAAMMITSIKDIVASLSIDCKEITAHAAQPSLFEEPQLTPEQKRLLDFLKNSDAPVQTDHIANYMGVPISKLLAILGEMEMDGIIERLPGNRFAPSQF